MPRRFRVTCRESIAAICAAASSNTAAHLVGHSSDRQCVTRKIAPAALAQLTALIRDDDFFSLKNDYMAPTDHGSVQVTITPLRPLTPQDYPGRRR